MDPLVKRLIQMASYRSMEAAAAYFAKATGNERDYQRARDNYLVAKREYEAICAEFSEAPYATYDVD